MHRLQKTLVQGYLFDVELEAQDIAEVYSIFSASDSKDDDVEEHNRLLESILDIRNLRLAAKRVCKNKGSSGIDNMKVNELSGFLKYKGYDFIESVLSGKYKVNPVRRIEIPKPDGGVRLLGIPTVIDRMLQQAVSQVLTPIFESGFSNSSFGFRPNRSTKNAVEYSRDLIESGYRWTVDIDLEKYFDTVNHDILMSIISKRIADKRVLRLIRSFLKSGVMLNGVIVDTHKGCPQGGPLSPLLSNIMLNELDGELERRGHKFSRYADDCNIYVKSQRAGERVMRNITNFLENRLKLKVNQQKSAVDRPWKRKFLGFSFYFSSNGAGIRVHSKSVMRYKDKVRKITSRSYSISMDNKVRKLNSLARGWCNYFGIASMKSLAEKLDQWTRRRLRMCYWKQWKKIKTKHDNLVRLGVNNYKAWE